MTFPRIVAIACTMAIAATSVPALAQYANEFSLAKVTRQGRTSQSVAGPGTVQVKVQVNADGSHKVISILKSTNPGDNAAATEIAQSSTYRPAHQGNKAVTSFYTFVLKFNGKSAAATHDTSGEAPSGGVPAGPMTGAPAGVTGPIEAAIRGGKYDEAVGKANVALISSPGNPAVLQLLGIAQYYKKDFAASANAFSKVDSIGKQYQPLAASSFASAAVSISKTNPTQSLEYAQKAVALDNNANSQFALGVAQLANNQTAQGAATLKGVHDKSSDPKVKLAIDQQLLSAYLATNDTADAASTQAEMKQLDPNGNSGAIAMGNHYLEAGNAALKAKNYADAVKAYEQAAATGDPKVTVTAYTGAAFAVMSMEKPDYVKAHDYAMKAVAAGPNDATAAFAAGATQAGIYATTKKASDKQLAIDLLNKADTLAKASNNTGLSLQIENQIKNIP